MKKKLIISLIALTAIIFGATSISASSTRMNGMGMVGDYWMIQSDTAYITGYNPAALSKFPALISGTYYGSNAVGVLFLNPMANLNLMFTTGLTTFTEGAQDPGNLTTPNEQLNGTASYKLGNMAFALGLGYGKEAQSDDTAVTGFDYSKTGIAANLGFMMNLGNGMDFDTAIHFTTLSAKESDADDVDTYSSDNMTLNFLARFNMALSEVNRLHVFASFDMKDLSDKKNTESSNNDLESRNFKRNTITLGVSDEFNLTKSSLAYIGLAYNLIMEEKDDIKIAVGQTIYTTKTNISYLTLRMGAEANFTQNWKGRFGAYRTFYTSTDTEQGAATTINTSSFANDTAITFTFGTSYKLGKLKADWFVDKDILKNGPYLLSGATNTTNWSTKVTIAYIFEGKAKAKKTETTTDNK